MKARFDVQLYRTQVCGKWNTRAQDAREATRKPKHERKRQKGTSGLDRTMGTVCMGISGKPICKMTCFPRPTSIALQSFSMEAPHPPVVERIHGAH